MAEPVKLLIPPSVANYVRPGTALEVRLRGAGGEDSLTPRDLVLSLFCLAKDQDQQVREKASITFACLEEKLLVDALSGWNDAHPAVLHMIAKVHGQMAAVRGVLLQHPLIAEATVAVLSAADLPAVPEAGNQQMAEGDSAEPESENADDLSAEDTDEGETEEEEPVDEEEFQSKYKLAQVMGIGEKIKMALTGDKEWRKILVKDSNKLVSSGVLKNPRITEPEVLTILKGGVQNDEIIRLICANREWVKNYPIRKALIENPKTPLANALRYLGTVNEKDLANYAKSRNISSVISTQAKRMLLNKKR